MFLGGSFSKMYFRQRPFNQKPLVFRKNPRTHLEVQGSFGDEGTFQECQKSWILKKPTIRWDRKLETRSLFRRRISFRSIRSRPNPLNRHMSKIYMCWQKFSFFSFFVTAMPLFIGKGNYSIFLIRREACVVEWVFPLFFIDLVWILVACGGCQDHFRQILTKYRFILMHKMKEITHISIDLVLSS